MDTTPTAKPPVEGLMIKIFRAGLLTAVGLLACLVMALDSYQP